MSIIDVIIVVADMAAAVARRGDNVHDDDASRNSARLGGW